MKKFLPVIFSLAAFVSLAQPIRFQKTIGIPGILSNCIVKPLSQGYIMLANHAVGLIQKSFSVIRLDSVGNAMWIKSFNGIALDGAGSSDINSTSDGGYILVVTVNETLPGHRLLVKLDSVGNIEWDRIGPWYTQIYQTSDGGYITGTGGRMIRMDSIGNIIWQKSYFVCGVDHLDCFQPTNDNGFILFGGVKCIASGGANDRDLYLIKTDSMGVVQWSKVFGTPTNLEQGYSVRQTFDGGFIMIGTCDTNNADIIVAKADPNGTLLWVKQYNGLEYDFGWDIQETFGTPGYVITGFTNGFEGQQQQGNRSFLVKLDLSGVPLWGNMYGDVVNNPQGDVDWIFNVHKTQDQGFLLSGLTMNFGVGSQDGWYIKTDNMGISGCNQIPNFPGYYSVNYVTNVGNIDSILNETVTGTDSLVLVTEQPINAILCLSGPTPVGINESNVTKSYVYPNPSSGKFNLEMESEIKEISVTDLTGKLIYQKRDIDSKEMIFDLTELSKGIYLLQVNTEIGPLFKKIILQ